MRRASDASGQRYAVCSSLLLSSAYLVLGGEVNEHAVPAPGRHPIEVTSVPCRDCHCHHRRDDLGLRHLHRQRKRRQPCSRSPGEFSATLPAELASRARSGSHATATASDHARTGPVGQPGTDPLGRSLPRIDSATTLARPVIRRHAAGRRGGRWHDPAGHRARWRSAAGPAQVGPAPGHRCLAHRDRRSRAARPAGRDTPTASTLAGR